MRRFVISVALICAILASASPAPADGAIELPGELVKGSVQAGGLERTYLAYIPSGKRSSAALIIAFHGSLGSGEKMRGVSGFLFDRLAEQQKCVIVYPDGIGRHWNDCRTVPGDEAHRKNLDDVGFTKALIDECKARWGIDTGKVYAVGLSNGGHLCFRLAVEIPDRIAGIAVIGASMPLPGLSKCALPRPGIPVMIINGTEDPINPFEGGMVRLVYVFTKGEVMSSLDSARQWLREEDRAREPVRTAVDDRDPQDGMYIERLTWPGSRAALYIVHGGGHTIPGGKQYLPRFLVGPVCHDIDAAREIWQFFLGQ